MANSTLKGALAIHGGNPQFLIEKVIRARIYDSIYWKEQCFALTAATVIDKAVEINAIGGVYGNQKPTQFLSLTLKLLTLQPEREILLEYLRAEEFKYLRALAAFYIRLTFRSIDVYEILEPLMKDYRKLRVRAVGGYSLTYFDEFIDQLLTEERVCDIILPKLTKRDVLEDTEGLAPRRSLLEKALNAESDSEGSTSSRPAKRQRRRSFSPVERRFSRTPSRTPSSAYASEGDDDEAGDDGRYRSRSRSVSADRMDEVELAKKQAREAARESRNGNERGDSEDGRRSRISSRSGSADTFRSRSRSVSLDRQ